MYSLYIDYPDSIGSYDFIPGDKDGNDVVSRKIGIGVKFICNSVARISTGDVYEVPFTSEEDMTAFVLKCRYKLVRREIVEKYKRERGQ